MTLENAMKSVEDLSKSQGFYGRLLRSLNENPKAKEKFAELCQDWKDPVDMVLALEG